MKPRAAIAAALAASLSACWISALHGIPDSTSRYDTLPMDARLRFEAARRDQEAGRVEEARARLADLFREHDDAIPVGIWLQEAEIALAEREGARGPERLREEYRKRADEQASVANLVLAARIEPDPVAAKVLLEKAEKKDRDCAWPPYALAWLAARAGDWAEVRSQLERARKADPGHMPTRWLEVWMLDRGGSVPEALTSLETWLDKARGDLALDQKLIRSAEVDRALLVLLAGRTREAARVLAGVDTAGLEPGHVQLVVAAIREAGEDPKGALAAAVEAERLRPGDLLPVVQQALLHEFWLSDPAAAESAWTRVLSISRASPELPALLERLRARVRLERLQAARTAGASPGS